MFIHGQSYQTELSNINNIRYILFTNFYSNPMYIESLKSIITKHIDCLSIDYDPVRYTFTIKIKKTSMRKVNGFSHESIFYHNIISSIFEEFLKTHERDVLNILSCRYPEPGSALQYIYSMPGFLANLCLVSCMQDNIVCIKL